MWGTHYMSCSLADGHLGDSHSGILVTLNPAAVNTREQAFVRTCVPGWLNLIGGLFGDTLRSAGAEGLRVADRLAQGLVRQALPYAPDPGVSGVLLVNMLP